MKSRILEYLFNFFKSNKKFLEEGKIENNMDKQYIIFITGAPGSGKGARRDVLEEYIKNSKNETCKIISMSTLLEKKGFMKDIAKGKLVKDEEVNLALNEELKIINEKFIIVDGFPRNELQAKMVGDLKKSEKYLNVYVINVHLDEEIVIERTKDRLVCPKCKKTYTISSFAPPKKEGFCDICNCELVKREDEKYISKRYEIYRSSLEKIMDMLTKLNVDIIKVDAAKDKNEIVNQFNEKFEQ